MSTVSVHVSAQPMVVEFSEDYFSDQIDSEEESELYAQIHHQTSSPPLEKIVDEILATSANVISVQKTSPTHFDAIKLPPLIPVVAKIHQSRVEERPKLTLERAKAICAKRLSFLQERRKLNSIREATQSLKYKLNKSDADGKIPIIHVKKVEKIVPIVECPSSEDDLLRCDKDDKSLDSIEINVLTSTLDVSKAFSKAGIKSCFANDSIEEIFLSDDEPQILESEKSNVGDPLAKKKNGSKKRSRQPDYSTDPEDWALDEKDIHPSLFKNTKIFREKTRLNKIICHNCKKSGHLSKFCDQERKYKTCFLCGLEGHQGEWCPNPICPACLRPGHQRKQCLWPRSNLNVNAVCCIICNKNGHLREECPDLWRRYHLTVIPGPIIQSTFEYPKTSHIWCYNCGHPGHYGEWCSQKRMETYLFSTSFNVSSYKEPTVDLPHLEGDFRRKSKKEEKLQNLLEMKNTLASQAHNRFCEKKGRFNINRRWSEPIIRSSPGFKKGWKTPKNKLKEIKLLRNENVQSCPPTKLKVNAWISNRLRRFGRRKGERWEESTPDQLNKPKWQGARATKNFHPRSK